MTSILSQGSEARLLQEGINAIATITYKDYPMEKDKIFTAKPSTKSYEIDVSLSGTGLLALKPEGTATTYDAEKQDWATTYVHDVWSLGTIITMEAQMNNLYRDLINSAGKILKRSAVHTCEQIGADVINNAYDTNITGGDGVSLANTAHVFGKGGTFSNRFSTFTAFSQAAAEDAHITIEDYRDGANLLIDAKVVSLHGPRNLRFNMDRILGSRFEPANANNAINPVEALFPGGYHINHRFNTTTDWFVKTDVDYGFCQFERMGYTFTQDNDFGTENFRSKVMFYTSFGWTDPRCAFFSGT